MTSHEKDLYKRTLGIAAEQSLPLQLVELHKEAERAWHGLGGADMKPEMLVMIMLMAGVLRRDNMIVTATNKDVLPTPTTTTKPNGPCLAIAGETVQSEVPPDVKGDIAINADVLVDDKHDAKFIGWTEGGRMRVLYPRGEQRHVAKSRVTLREKETVNG